MVKGLGFRVDGLGCSNVKKTARLNAQARGHCYSPPKCGTLKPKCYNLPGSILGFLHIVWGMGFIKCWLKGSVFASYGNVGLVNSITLRVQVPNNHIPTHNLYQNYYYPNPKYPIIRYMDPLGKPQTLGLRWLAWDAATRTAFAQPGGVGLKVLQAARVRPWALGFRALGVEV